jgi:hypothetical protein
MIAPQATSANTNINYDASGRRRVQAARKTSKLRKRQLSEADNFVSSPAPSPEIAACWTSGSCRNH